MAARKTSKLTAASMHLLNEIVAGRDRVFYMTDRPNGWVHVERAGLAIRDPNDENRAILTDAGRIFMGVGTITGSGQADRSILQRVRDQIIYDRRVN